MPVGYKGVRSKPLITIPVHLWHIVEILPKEEREAMDSLFDSEEKLETLKGELCEITSHEEMT
eukprot:1231661-Ditylum_brightwellii.AAC.1